MQLPYWRFILYQLSRKLSDLEVQDACATRGLALPNETYLRTLRRQLGVIPHTWQRTLSGASPHFVRWLRDKDLLFLWKAGPDMAGAYEVLQRAGLRRDIEGVMILRGDVDTCYATLATKYREDYLPTKRSIAYYLKAFWDFSKMSSAQVLEFLEEYAEKRPEIMAALGEDEAAVCGVLGLKYEVNETEFLDGVIALADQQITRARSISSKGPLNGATVMGLAALTKQAMDAMDRKREIGVANSGADSEMRKSALRFKMSSRRSEAPPSLEDLRAREEEPHAPHSNVIEAEFSKA